MTEPCVVVPQDLIETVFSSQQRSGWFGGLQLSSEQVFVLFECQLAERRIFSKNERLLPHRAEFYGLGDYKQELLQWVMVEAGFGKIYARGKSVTEEEYRQLVGIEIPDQQLHFAAIEPNDKEAIFTSVMARKLKSGSVRLYQTDFIVQLSNADPFSRLPKQLVQDLQGKSVTLVGLGSGGGEIALNLASAGVGKLQLVDSDRVRPENYIRFAAGRQDLGRYKVDAVRSIIQDRELSTQVDVVYLDVVYDADEFLNSLPSPLDLIICGTDSIASRRLVNSVALAKRLPCIITGTLDSGRIGEILRIEPYVTPCYECIRMDLGAALETPEDTGRANTPYSGSEAGEFETALRMDVVIPAALASRVALQMLNPSEFGTTPASYIVWGRDADRRFSEPFQFSYPFATNYVPIRRRKDCPLCGGMPAELVGIDVVQKAGEILSEADRNSQ
jgi:molybdopterin/thiamine biosynthesis adenylyltransferase